MAYAIINSACYVSTTSNGFTSAAADTTGADWIAIFRATVTSGGNPTDSNNNTWGTTTERVGAFSDRYSEWYVCQGPTVGAGHTFTIGGTVNFPSLLVVWGTGSATTPLDQQNGGGNYGTTHQVGSVTPSADNEIILCGTQHELSELPTIDLSFTRTNDNHDGNFGHQPTVAAYLIQTTAVAKNPTWSFSTNTRSTASIITLKAAAAGGGSVKGSSALPSLGAQ